MIQNEKPRLVDISQGFSFLKTIEYKGTFLYSKYNPTKAIETVVDELEILPGTLIVIYCPLLWYGIEKLVAKLPEDCPILALENDDNLEEIAREHLEKLDGIKDKIFFSSLKENRTIEEWIHTLVSTGKIKRSLRIDFSAAVRFDKELYDYTALAIQDMIATFWKNRITMVKMGKLFSKNLIKNLVVLKESPVIEDVEKSITKPILVLGAGEGVDSIQWEKVDRNNFFILAADAALLPLLGRNIVPDAVCGMESQFAIQKAYTGIEDLIGNRPVTFFADLSSRNEIVSKFPGKTVFFASRYSDGIFFDNLAKKGIIKNWIMPMGSVGLAAVNIALRLRKSQDIEVFTAGLDFSYTPGATHAKGTMAHKARLMACNRIAQIDNIDAAFAQGAAYVPSKNGKVITTRILHSYAQQFTMFFGKEENLFDASTTGLDLGLPRKTLDEATNTAGTSTLSLEKPEILKDKVNSFLEGEKNALEAIKSLLSKGTQSEYYDGKNLEEQLRSLLECREYLYLHFPDGYHLSMDTGFLKRVRAEVDNFLKWLK